MLRYLICGLLAAISFVNESSAETGEGPKVDAVFDLGWIQNIAIDSRSKDIFVATADKIFHLGTFPQELKEQLDTSTLTSHMGLSRRKNLYVAGLDFNRETISTLGGRIVSYKGIGQPGGAEEFPIYANDPSNTGIGQFSWVSFDQSGNVYFASPVDLSVLTTEDIPKEVVAGTIIASIPLTCGPSDQFTVLEVGDHKVYFSSVANDDLLEIGAIYPPSRKIVKEFKPECFNATNVFSAQKGEGPKTSLQHRLLSFTGSQKKNGPNKGIIVLDPNSNKLFVFRLNLIEGASPMTRNQSVDLDLDRYAADASKDISYGLLASSNDGSVILVSGFGLRRVLRFSFENGKFSYHGFFEMKEPVWSMQLSADGALGAIVTGTGAFGSNQEITLIKHPGLIGDNRPLDRSRDSIRRLQSLLVESGVDAGQPDGIYGSLTEAAVNTYVKSENAELADPKTKELNALINGIFPTLKSKP